MRVAARVSSFLRRRNEPVLKADPAMEEPAPPVPEPGPETEPAPEPAPPAPDPSPPRPEPGQPTPQLSAVPEPPPAPAPEPEAALEADTSVAYLPEPDGTPREWNVWELERVAHEVEGEDPARDEELAYLLVELRQFATADGRLAVSFDPVVRASFGNLLYSAI
jgi:hypothetical protein